MTLFLLGFLIYYFSDIVIYVVISWVLSMLGQPIMNFFRHTLKFKRFKFGEALGSILTLIMFTMLFVTLFIVFVPLIVSQVNNFAELDYHEIYLSLEDPIQMLNEKLMGWGLVNDAGVGPETLRETIGTYFSLGELGSVFGSIFSFAGNFFIGIFSIFFISFFFLQDNTLFTNIILAIVPNKYELQTKKVISDISKMLRRYFIGLLIQVTTITILVSSALALLGIQNALLIGFFAAIINLIPYIGPLIGASFGVIITISSNLDVEFYSVMLPKILKVTVVFASMQLIDNFLLQPFIYGTSAKAHPLEIFIVILIAAKLGEIPGMVIAIPVYIVIRVIAGSFLNRFKLVQKLTGGLIN